jgi:hypothetical protein
LLVVTLSEEKGTTPPKAFIIVNPADGTPETFILRKET